MFSRLSFVPFSQSNSYEFWLVCSQLNSCSYSVIWSRFASESYYHNLLTHTYARLADTGFDSTLADYANRSDSYQFDYSFLPELIVIDSIVDRIRLDASTEYDTAELEQQIYQLEALFVSAFDRLAELNQPYLPYNNTAQIVASLITSRLLFDIVARLYAERWLGIECE